MNIALLHVYRLLFMCRPSALRDPPVEKRWTVVCRRTFLSTNTVLRPLDHITVPYAFPEVRRWPYNATNG